MGAHDAEFQALLHTASALDRGALLELGAQPGLEDVTERDRARAVARGLVERQGLGDDLDRMGDEIIRWSGAGGAMSGMFTFASPPSDVLLADIRQQVVPALMDVAMTLLLGDGLDPASREALLSRWHEVTGPID